MKELRIRFENADMAEWALVRLRERGLHPDRYRILTMAQWGESPMPRGHLVNTAAALTGLGPIQTGDATPSMIGNVTWGIAMGGIGDGERPPEAASREVELRLLIPDRDAQTVESILISYKGRPVSMPEASSAIRL